MAAGGLFDRTGNYHIAWAACLAFTILTFLLMVGLKEIRPKETLPKALDSMSGSSLKPF